MGTLVCRVELDKNKGLILTVENKEGKITQTAVLNGESITLTSKGEKETSSITQKPDSVEIKCKDFTLESETITCKSTKDTLHKSEQKFDVQSTKDMTLTSDAKYSAKATGDVSVSGKKVAVSASGKAEFSGGSASISSTGNTEVAAGSTGTLSLTGGLKTEMGGKMVEISADGIMTVKGKMTNVEGKMASVKGTAMTKVG
jgi:hypothetical protein